MNPPLQTTTVIFGTDAFDDLMGVTEGSPAPDALELARTLAGGITQICQRLHADIDDGGSAYCDEIRAIGFLGCVVSALTQSVSSGLEEGGEQ